MKDLKRRLRTLVADIDTNLKELKKRAGHEGLSPIARPPATAAQIAAYEEFLGLTLPPSYRAFLELHNGYDRLAFPGDMVAIEDVMPGGKRFEAVREWKRRSAKYGAEEVLDGVVIANLGQNNNWAFIDPRKKSRKKGELTIVEWEPSESEDYPSLVEFLEECLETIKYGIAEADGTLPDDEDD